MQLISQHRDVSMGTSEILKIDGKYFEAVYDGGKMYSKMEVDW